MLSVKRFLARLLIVTMLLTSTGMITFATSVENNVKQTIKTNSEQTDKIIQNKNEHAKKTSIENENINQDGQDIIINNEEIKEENNDKLTINQIEQEEKPINQEDNQEKNEQNFINNDVENRDKENQTEQKQSISDDIIGSVEQNNQNASENNNQGTTNNEKLNDIENTTKNKQDNTINNEQTKQNDNENADTNKLFERKVINEEQNADTATISDTDFEEHTKTESEDIDKKESVVDFATTSNISAETKKLDETINVNNENNVQNENNHNKNVDISTDSETTLFGGGEESMNTEQEVEYVLAPGWYNFATESYINFEMETIKILKFPDACPTEVDEKWDIPNSNGLIGYKKGKEVYIYAPTRGTIYTAENCGNLFTNIRFYYGGGMSVYQKPITHFLPLSWYNSEIVGIEKNEVTKIEFITDLERLPSDVDVQWDIPNSNGLVGYRKGTDIIICALNKCDYIGILDRDYKYIFSGMTDNISFKSNFICLVDEGETTISGFARFITPSQINGEVVDYGENQQYTECIKHNTLQNIYGLDYLNTSRTIRMSGMFIGDDKLVSLDLSSFDTSKVEDMYAMFEGCSSLTTLDLSSFDTSKVEYMYRMFEDCSNLTSIDFSSFDTSKVKDMSRMFKGCSNLTSLNLSNFNTTNVSSMCEMFNNCNKLKTIVVSKQFVTENVDDAERYNFLFHNCISLVGGNGTSYTTLYRSLTYARIDTSETPGYFTSKEQFKKSESEIKKDEKVEPETTARQNNYRGGSSSGGGGGGGSRIAPAELLKTNAITNTTLSLDFKSIPISFTNQTKSKWQADDKGKWHLTTVNNFGQTETVKNSWACIETDATVNGKQIKVTNFYFFDKDGNMLTGWLTDNTGKKYYLDTSANSEQGKMVRGWKNIENNYYYFTGDGILLTNSKTPDGYTVGIDGKWVK